MKNISLYILALSFLTSCLERSNCSNQFEFISCNDDSIPILNLDITKDYNTIRNDMNKLYGFDLCEKCDWVAFRMPFRMDGQKGHLKVLTDFDSPVCENCSMPIRIRHYFSIKINQRNQLLAQGELIELDSLQTKIENYLSSVGVNKMAPKNFSQINYSIFWNQDSDSEFLDSVLTTLYFSHLSFVKKELEKDGIEFCKMKKVDLDKLKEKYPLRIEFDLGKNEMMKLPPTREQFKELETIETIEEIELKVVI